MPKEEVPYGYVKAYNPILIAASMIMAIQMVVFTVLTMWVLTTPVTDRDINGINIWTNWLQLAVSFGLFYTTYKLAKMSEDPLRKLKRLAQDAEKFLEYGETLMDVFAPVFNWLRGIRERMLYDTISKEEVIAEIDRLTKKLELMYESEGFTKKEPTVRSVLKKQ